MYSVWNVTRQSFFPPGSYEHYIEILRENRSEKGSFGTLSTALREFENRFFLRFFGSNPISIKYFCKSVLLSSISILFVLSFQIGFKFSLLIEYLDSIPNLLFFFSVLIINFFIDYVSIFQTQVFLEFANSTKSSIRKFVAIVSDIVVTTNGFIFLFSALFFICSALFIVFIQNPEIRSLDSRAVYEVSKSPSGDGIKYKIIGNIITNTKGGKKEQNIIETELYSNRSFFNPSYFFHSSTDQNDQDIYVDGKKVDESKITQKDSINYVVELENTIQEIEIDEYLFYNIFRNIDNVEDGFLAIISSEFKTVNFYQIVSFNIDQYYELYKANLCFVTFEDGDKSIGKYINVESEYWSSVVDECQFYFQTATGKMVTDGNMNYHWGGSIIYSEIPIYTFFLSTLASTFLIYVFVLIIYFYKLIQSFSWRFGITIAKYFLRAPFSIIFVLIFAAYKSLS